MRIEVYKDWIIRTNKGDKGYTLCKSAGFQTRVDEKTGQEVQTELYKGETYPATIEGCLNAIARQELIDSKATTFKGLQKEILELKAMVADIGKQLDGK